MGKAKQWYTLTRVSSFVYRERQTCNCPTRLSVGAVDSLIRKLRSIFNALGRSGDWDDRFGLGNPAWHLSNKQYLKSVQTEQAQARVLPKQATPVSFDNFKKLYST